MQRGMSMLELAIVLGIIAILAAVLTPILSQYVDDARTTAAMNDAKAIGDAIVRLEKDLGRYPMFTSGAGLLQDSNANVVRLQGPGTMPSESAVTAWTSGTPGDADCTAACTFADINGQLTSNTPVYPTTTSSSKPFHWKGPYMTVQSDPWGNTYLVNIINAKSGSADACFVLSAGPNGRVETAFNIPKTSLLTAGGDDLVFRIK